MKSMTLLFTLLFAGTASAVPNNVPNPPGYFSNNTPIPYNNNYGSNWNMPNMNWGNGNGYKNGSNWNMPSMNWGNGNGSGYQSGNNWNMPNFNWGNNGWGNNGAGNNWNMPSMNWGNNNGRGSNWNMPNMNWGNTFGNGYGNGSNWNMPNFNWNNQQHPWNYGPRNYYNNNRFAPNMQPRFAPKPPVNTMQQSTYKTDKPANKITSPKPTSQNINADSKNTKEFPKTKVEINTKKTQDSPK